MTNIKTVTAAILVIGDEILSGRTKDKNIGYIAEYLNGIGIDVKEVRVVPDEEDEIISAINTLRAKYTYLFTTGGIGPTHDDITADCVAKAFNVSIDVNEDAVNMMLMRYDREDLNEARLRMARIPFGAELVENPISRAPGFKIGNVITMAGVPKIMQAMLDNVAPTLEGGTPYLQHTFETDLKEGDIAHALGEIASSHEAVSIGSYPSYFDGKFSTRIVLRSKSGMALDTAKSDVAALVQSHS